MMKKNFLKTATALMSLTMLVTSTGVSAMKTGNVSYSVDGAAVNSVVPGTLTSTVKVADNGVGNTAQLITAVYDDITGALSGVSMSDVADVTEGASFGISTSTTLATLDGYSVKHFVWSGNEMIPYSNVKDQNLYLKAASGVEKVNLIWQQVTASDKEAVSYRVYKDDEVIKTVSADCGSAYIAADATEAEYYVEGLAEDGSIVSVSNTVWAAGKMPYVAPEVKEPENLKTSISAATATATTITQAFRGTTKTGDFEAVISADGDMALYGKQIPLAQGEDGSWTTTETVLKEERFDVKTVGGRDAFLVAKYANESGTSKRGYLYFLLNAEKYTSDFSGMKITFDYYDYAASGANAIGFECVNPATGKNVSVDKISLTETDDGWKTATYYVNAAVNSDINNALYGSCAEFRITAYDNYAYIDNVSVEAYLPTRAELTIGDEANTATVSSGRTTTKGANMVHTGNATLVENSGDKKRDDISDAYYTTGTDQSYMLTTGTDTNNVTKDAVMAVNCYRISNSKSNQSMYLAFRAADTFDEYTNVAIEMTYLSTAATKAQYSTAAGEGKGTLDIPSTNGVWTTSTFEIADLNFALFDYENDTSKFDFRVRSTAAPLYIHSVKITAVEEDGEATAEKLLEAEYELKSENGDTLYPDGVSISLDASGNVISNGITVANGAVNTDRYSTISQLGDGYVFETQSYVQTTDDASSAKLRYINFAVDDAYMYGRRDSVAEIAIEYYDGEGGDIYFQYNTNNSLVGPVSNTSKSRIIGAPTATNTFKTVKFILDDACFVNKGNGSSDFRMRMDTSKESPQQLKIKSITIKRNPVTALEKMPEEGAPVIYIAGDSIAADYDEDREGGRKGWGMRLGNYLSDEVVIGNYAVAGSSTASFGNYNAILDSLKKNDYVIMSFGHNDSMTNKYVSVEDYKANLKAFASKVLMKKATPVIASAIPTFDTTEYVDLDVAMSDGIDVYREAAKAVADEMKLSFIDLGGEMKQAIKDAINASEDPSDFNTTVNTWFETEYVTAEDGTSAESTTRVHLLETGAVKAAEIIIDALKADTKIRVLNSNGYILEK